MHESSKSLFEQARKLMPGGVSSPVRAVDPYPRTIQRGQGATVTDVDGTSYVDLCMAFGPMILGHAPPAVVEVLEERLREGWNFGANNPPELELAERVTSWVPGVDQVRFVNSGTEATMHAIRLARGVTGRDGVVKTPGAYHGAHDSVLVKAGSGVATQGLPGTDGVPADAARHTRLVPFNDAGALAELLEREGEDIACVILEPVMGNTGTIPPEPGYLEEVRRITEAHDVLLVFDEVITGARLGPGGAQERFGVVPDLTTLGKVLGGGLPIGAFGGRVELMRELAPEGPVYQAGTASGNPLTMAAGVATLDTLEATGWSGLEGTGDALRQGLTDLVVDRGVPATVQGLESMFTLFFQEGPVRNGSEAKQGDEDAYWIYHRTMMEEGVYLPPSPYETNFVSTAHGADEVDAVLAAADAALAEVM